MSIVSRCFDDSTVAILKSRGIYAKKFGLDAIYQTNYNSEEETLNSITNNKILAPFSKEEINEILLEHNVAESDIHKWSYARILLDYNGWISQRVGNRIVPITKNYFYLLPQKRVKKFQLTNQNQVLTVLFR